MGNKKKISDIEVLRVAVGVIVKHGPESFTLADVSKKTNLSPATLIQRFRTKERLLILALEQSNLDLEAEQVRTAASGARGLAGLSEFLGKLADGLKSERPEQQLDLLAKDLKHPRLKKVALARMQFLRSSIRNYLEQAVADKELTTTRDLDELATDIEALWHGSAIQWIFRPEGSPGAWFARRLESIEPYRLQPAFRRH